MYDNTVAEYLKLLGKISRNLYLIFSCHWGATLIRIDDLFYLPPKYYLRFILLVGYTLFLHLVWYDDEYCYIPGMKVSPQNTRLDRIKGKKYNISLSAIFYLSIIPHIFENKDFSMILVGLSVMVGYFR